MAAQKAPPAPDRPLLVQQLQQAFAGLLQLGQGKRAQAQVVVVLLLGFGGSVQPPADSAARVTGAQAVAGLLKVVTNQLALAGLMLVAADQLPPTSCSDSYARGHRWQSGSLPLSSKWRANNCGSS